MLAILVKNAWVACLAQGLGASRVTVSGVVAMAAEGVERVGGAASVAGAGAGLVGVFLTSSTRRRWMVLITEARTAPAARAALVLSGLGARPVTWWGSFLEGGAVRGMAAWKKAPGCGRGCNSWPARGRGGQPLGHALLSSGNGVPSESTKLVTALDSDVDAA